MPRFAIWQRRGADAIVYGRKRSLTLPGAADFLDAADGRHTLEALLPLTSGPRALGALLELVSADFAALKLLPAGESTIPRWAESSMPWAAIALTDLVGGRAATHEPADMAGYHAAIGDAEAQFEETETTLSHLFHAPHMALGGETFGERLAAALHARGVPAEGARVVETGGGLGFVGHALSERLRPQSYLVVERSPALARVQRRRGLRSVVGDALRLPIADASVDLVVSNEMCGDLGSDERSNYGALVLVDECARVLAPGGIAYVSEFGHPSRPPTKSDHLDHDEYSIRFGDLRARARALGLVAELVPLPRLIDLDGEPEALVTTRASFAALRALLGTHGVTLTKRAVLMGELRESAARVGLDLNGVHGLVSAPIGDRTMGLCPSDFWALIARRPA